MAPPASANDNCHNEIADLTFFRRIPWCARLLAAPNLRIFVPDNRRPKLHSGEDALLAQTLNTPGTIPASLAFYPRDAPTPTAAPSPSSTSPAAAPSPATLPIPALSTLHYLSAGLAGYPSTLHGGLAATLLDEACGTLLLLNAERLHLSRVASGHAAGELPDLAAGAGAVTVELRVRYRAPVRVPGVVLVKVRVVRREGRKVWLGARVLQKSGGEQELDGEVVECAVGEVLFVEPREVKM